MAIAAPYGSWRSIIGSAEIAAGGRRLSQPRLHAGHVYWLEGRPSEGGRQVVVRSPVASPGTGHEDLSPPDVNVRSTVHEYGGGDYAVSASGLDFVRFDDQRIWRGGGQPLGLKGARHADFVRSPDGRLLAAVEESPREGGEPENRLVCFAQRPDGEMDPTPSVLFAEADFVSAPTFSPDGRRLAFTCWHHPHMPWDVTELHEVEFDQAGPRSVARRVVVGGGSDESILQPRYSPDGVLTFISDRSGWWNLYQMHQGEVRALCPRSAEFAGPQWVFGLSWYDFIDADTILCVRREAGRDVLANLEIKTGRLEDWTLPHCEIGGVRVDRGHACFMAGGSDSAAGVAVLDLAKAETRMARSSSALDFDPAWLSRAEAIEFASTDGRRAHAYYYAPCNPDCEAPAGERPPLLVKSHGGPTAAASSSLDPRIQYWTSRGFAILDVDYAGSTGYGRDYRKSLEGCWGVADVEDCIAGARALADDGRVDSQRLAISGGSAGGFTTLCALTFHDVFAAGASHYGIGDLEALLRDTHKFEARYLDGLVGPYPERADLYRARSPIHSADRLSCPVIFFQGLEDRVVPPNQSEAMAAALAEQGIAHAYVTFEGEQHGFRQAKNIRTALDGEAWFYGRVFGFDSGPAPEGVRLEPGSGLFET